MRGVLRSLHHRFTVLALLPLVWLSPERFTGKVVSITDGDTISVMHEARPLTVRLDGIDCPERGQDFSQRAKQFTSDLAFGQTVDVDVRDVDRYGRLVARVSAQGRDVSVALVRAGMAWHYKQYSSDPILAEAERAARAEGLGLWSRHDAVPPWEYRHPVALAADVAVGPFHGNQRSRVFHRPGCPNYDCKNCTRIFQTSEQAVGKGFRPAGDCLRAR